MATSDGKPVKCQVKSARPDVFLDDQGKAINGWSLTVYLVDFNETHQVRVATQDKKEAAQKISTLIAWRESLLDLGTE
jgi:hypothetical protein